MIAVQLAQSFGRDLRVLPEAPVDERAAPELLSDLGQQLANSARPEAMEFLDLAAEADVVNEVPDGLADMLPAVSAALLVLEAANHDNHRHRQTGRWPQCRGATINGKLVDFGREQA